MKLIDILEETSPSGSFFVDNIVIIGPYPTKSFFKDQLSKIKPRSITLYVDDGWPEDNILDIEWYLKRYTDIEFNKFRVKCPGRDALVHAKVYLIEWVNSGNKHRRRQLIVGSHNASSSGFGKNAEALVSVDLANSSEPECQKNVLQYFNSLKGEGYSDEILLSFNKGSYFYLPALEVSSVETASGFDAWFRRGRLCHKYSQDASFGKLPIRLKKALPIAEIENAFATEQFGKIGESTVLVRPYVNYSAIDDNESSASRMWKGRYFIETDYGYWTSAECYRDLCGEFKGWAAESRETALDWIKSASDLDRVRLVDEHVAALQNVVSQLHGRNEIAEEYLQLKAGFLDEDFYKISALAKLKQDQNKALDEEFCARFVSGFSFPLVPSLEDGFDNFAENFCSTLFLKSQQKRPINRLAKIIKELEGGDRISSGAELLAELRSNWGDLYSQLISFYRDDSEGGDD